MATTDATTTHVSQEALAKILELQKNYIDTNDGKKQDKLTAGKGIEITSGNVINVTLDTDVFKYVESLPTTPASGDEGKIHLVKNTTAGETSGSANSQNTYDEYIWDATAQKWELVGSSKVTIDMTPYLKLAELLSTVNTSGVTLTKKGETLAQIVFNTSSFTGSADSNVLTLDLKDILSEAAASGFYKVAVDKKGRVTAVTAVTKDDVKALGFKDSEEIEELEGRIDDLEEATENMEWMTATEAEALYKSIYEPGN